MIYREFSETSKIRRARKINALWKITILILELTVYIPSTPLSVIMNIQDLCANYYQQIICLCHNNDPRCRKYFAYKLRQRKTTSKNTLGIDKDGKMWLRKNLGLRWPFHLIVSYFANWQWMWWRGGFSQDALKTQDISTSKFQIYLKCLTMRFPW